MGNLFGRKKPTQASYFLSESQRKRTSRLSFIYGSPRLVAVITVLALSSLLVGTLIIQKQNDSRAEVFTKTENWAVGSPDGFGANLKDGVGWGFKKDAFPVSATNNTGQNLKITIPQGSVQPTANVQACWVLNIPGDVSVNRVKFNVTSNAFGTSQVNILRNSEVIGTKNDFGNTPANHDFDIGITPTTGGTVSVCHKVLQARTFSTERIVYVRDYAVFGTKTIVNDTMQTTDRFYSFAGQTSPPATMTNGDTATVEIKVKNEGKITWQNDSTNPTNPVRLGTTNATDTQRDRVSLLHNEGDGNWFGRTRVKMVENNVPPGAIGTFRFTIVARSTTATTAQSRTEWFNLVQEGVAWFPARGLSFTVNVLPKPVAEAPAVDNPCLVTSSTYNPVPVAAVNSRLGSGATKITDGSRNVVRLDAPGEFVDCSVSLPNAPEGVAGGYVLAYSGKGGPTDSEIDLLMQSGTDNIQRDTQPVTTLDYGAPIDTKSRMTIIPSDTATQKKTVRKLVPGEKVLVRVTLKKGSFNLENFQLYRDPCADENGNDIRATTQDADCKVAIEQSQEQAQERQDTIDSGQPPTTPPPTNTDETPTNAPTTCSAVGSVEAEDAIRKNLTATANDPLHPEVRSAVLFTEKSYVECTLEAPKTGRYAFGAKIRSDDFRNEVARAKIEMKDAKSTASRDINAPKEQVYGLVRFNDPADYRELSQGDKVVVRVSFLNDGRDDKGGDRNLWVDSILLVEIPNAPQADTGGSNEPSGIVPCAKLGTAEAEDGSLYNGASVQADSSASGGKSVVRLKTNAQYVECALKAPTDGEYIVGAVAKSDNRPLQDKAIAQLAMIAGGKIQQSDTQVTTGSYDRIRMRVNDSTKRNMKAGSQVIVRISVTNASNNTATKKHLLIDSLSLIKIPTTAPPQAQPVDPSTEPSIPEVKEAWPSNAEQVSYNPVTGAVLVKIEAEKATHTSLPGAIFEENLAQKASGGKAVRLFANKHYVEHTFQIPETDTYSLDFAGRSENFDGVANARIVLDGKKLFGDDIKLISSPIHNYYTSEKRVQIQKGLHTFRVEFPNDKRGTTGDRNLIVDYLRIRGTKRLQPIVTPPANEGSESPTNTTPKDVVGPNTQAVEAENASYCQATKVRILCEQLAIPDEAAHGSRALVLNKKGDFVETQFTTNVSGSYAIGATLRSMDYNGSAKADIYVDGSKVASGVTPNSESYRPTFMYKKDFKENTTHKIKVVFINDQCGSDREACNSTNDRNLLVDHLRLTFISESVVIDQPPSNVGRSTDYRFISMPDFLNADIGDVTKSPFYNKAKAGNRNSTSPEWNESLKFIMDSIKSEGIRDVFIAGDFVEGEWGKDTENTGIFGPVGTVADKRRAVIEAGNVYYKQGMKRFTDRDLVVYPAIGDHEIGDNPWGKAAGGYTTFKYNNLDIFKRTYSNHFMKNNDGTFRFSNRPTGQARDTAYAVRPHPEVQLVSLDVFQKTSETVIPSLDSEQLAWVEKVLQKANQDGVDWIIVQGHTPIFKYDSDVPKLPNRHSSTLMYQGGLQSPLWKLLAKYKVDLYFAGEVHETSVRRADGVTQLAHGSMMMMGDQDYLVGSISGDRMTLQVKQFSGGTFDNEKLWCTDTATCWAKTRTKYINPPSVTGTMIMKNDNSPIIYKDGRFNQ